MYVFAFPSSCNVFILSETRDEISRRIEKEGKTTEEGDDNANLRSKQNADVVEPGTLAKNKEVLDVKDPNWQVDEIGSQEKAGNLVEEENNENIDIALVKVEQGVTLERFIESS